MGHVPSRQILRWSGRFHRSGLSEGMIRNLSITLCRPASCRARNLSLIHIFAKYPLEERSASKLLVYERGEISERRFRDIGDILPEGTLLVFNNTKVIRARITMHKPSGARIEVFCLEPHDPADYERAFAVKGSCRWSCIVGNLKKWKDGPLVIDFEYEGRAERMLAWREGEGGREQIVRFEWTADLTFEMCIRERFIALHVFLC